MPTSIAYFKKEYVPLAEANLNIITNFMHYGTCIFEGIRGNWNQEKQELYLFRLKEHYQRLLMGCRVLKIKLPYSAEELCDITVQMARKCEFKEDIYVRPLAYKSSEKLGVRLHDIEDDFFVFAIPWGRYLDTDKARVIISSWRCLKESPRAKIGGLYVNNALAKSEALEAGFDEAIMLTNDNYIAEGSGENLFMVVNGKLHTPASHNSILMGITRATIIQMAKDELGIDTVERSIERSELYNADECFLTGTAAHLTPVAEVDRRKIGSGEVGPVTARLQKLYFDVIRGANARYLNWCTPVYK
jgi:branched-chain amino acid aminotransferase